jgi:hypothetical protein
MPEEKSGASETAADGLTFDDFTVDQPLKFAGRALADRQRTVPVFPYPLPARNLYTNEVGTAFGTATIDLESGEIVIKLGNGPDAEQIKQNLRTMQEFYLSGLHIREDMRP